MRERGAALLVAVATAALLAAIALEVTRASRTAVLVATNERRAAEAGAAAEAGLVRLMLALAEGAWGRESRPAPEERPAPGGPPPLGAGGAPVPDGRAYALRLGEARLILRARAEAGKIDLNAADPDLLARLAREVGLGAEEAEAVAAAVAAARRRDGRGGVSWRISRHVFDRVDALVRHGVGERALARLAPHLTVETGRALPDPRFATEAVFAALPLDREARALHAAERRALEAWRPEGAARLSLMAEAVLADGTTARAGALVEIRPEETPPLRVLRRAGPMRPPAAGEAW